LGYAFSGKFPLNHATLVIASSILTASMVSLILGTTMITVILLSKRFRINPDNVATPVAGSLGDVVTLGMLSCFSSIIFDEMNGEQYNSE
jgi:solute carrier family 41